MTSEDNEIELGVRNVCSRSKTHDDRISNPASDHSDLDDDGRPRRRGTVWTASSHVLTTIVGSGVLTLAWSIAQMGWVAGPLVLFSFSAVTLYTAILLADCYRSPNPVTGKRNYTYGDAVLLNLGPRYSFWCTIVQNANLVTTAVGYTITAAISMVAVERSNCFHNENHKARCHVSNNPYMVAFGVVQIVLSQIPNFANIDWLSVVAAVMSSFYSSVALGLGIAKTIGGKHSHGRLGGTPIGSGHSHVSKFGKTWSVFRALGNMAFAYTFSMVLIDIQDTLRGPPEYGPENQTMKKASFWGIGLATFFYVSVGTAGYLAFGNNAPSNILTGFGFYNPFWLVDLANIAVVVHLVGAYQIFCQPFFAFVEGQAKLRWPNNKFIHKEIRCFRTLHLNWFRLSWRSTFVIFTTLTAMLLPFFNDVTGLIGAFSFFPLTVYLPVKMYMKAREMEKWSRKWVALQALNIGTFLVCIAAAIGAAEGLKESLEDYKPFRTVY